MKIALVHELLTMRGGAEKVLKVLADMFPEAPIYTLLYDEKKLGDWFPKERVRTSILQLNGAASMNHHLYLKRFPKAVEDWDFSAFDLVISSSSAFVHGIITNGKPKHLSIIQSPARYLWDRTHDVVDRASGGRLGFLKRLYLERVFHKLRIWDSEAADRPDVLIAASKEVQRRIELYWRRESTVIHPPIDDFWLEEKWTVDSGQWTVPYFLIVSTLVPYKRIDFAIEAANKANVPLKIAGEGPALASLQALAGPTVEFLGRVENDTLQDLFTGATATLFPGEEDFGLVPVESMACGTPVIAYRAGGALETVVEGKTGVFFDEQTSESLADVLKTFERKTFQEEDCREQAKEFSRQHFEKGIRDTIDKMFG